MKVPIEAQVAEVKRELMARDSVFPKLVEAGKLEASVATLRQRDMQAVLRTLEWVQKHRETLVLAHEIASTQGAADFVRSGLKTFPGAQVNVRDRDDEARGSEAGSGSVF